MKRLSSFLIARDWACISIGTGLIAVWLLVLAGVPTVLPTQAASWLVFLALLIAPGYLLGDLITRRLGLDLSIDWRWHCRWVLSSWPFRAWWPCFSTATSKSWQPDG